MCKDFFKFVSIMTLFAIFTILILLYLCRDIKNVECVDGDTFKSGEEYFRLANIDTPEKGEIGYKEASVLTCDYLKSVELSRANVSSEDDKYGRTIITIPDLEKMLIGKCLAEPFYGETTKDILKLYYKSCKLNEK